MTDTVHFTKVNDKKPLRTPVFKKVNEEPRFKKVEDKPHFAKVKNTPSQQISTAVNSAEIIKASRKRMIEHNLSQVTNNCLGLVLKMMGQQDGNRGLEFWDDCFETNFNVYEHMPETIKDLYTAKYNKIKDDLEKHGIKCPERFVLTRAAKEVMSNLDNIGRPDGRPLAVLIYGRADHNGSFKNNRILDLLDKGYKVVYLEAETDSELIDHFLSATKKQKADLLVVAGHGTEGSIDLGAGRSEENRLDLSDRQQLNQARVAERMARGGTLVLESCSTGQGGTDNYNMANMLRQVFGAEIDIFSPDSPAAAESYQFDDSGKVNGVIYDKATTYAIR